MDGWMDSAPPQNPECDTTPIRKAGGIYYTPPAIVDYIVGKCVLPALRAHPNAAPLPILDPACGAGAFLIGAYHALHAWYRRRFARPLTLDERARLVHDHLYGVDIDPRAVAATRHALIQAVGEGEAGAAHSVPPSLPCPDFSHNIRCGNALLGADFPADAGHCPFDWEQAFPAILRRGGFGVVIGNPPWGFTRNVAFAPALKRYLARRYTSAHGKINLCALFLERGLSLLRPGGCLAMIVPNTVLRSTTYAPLRDHLLRHYGLEQITDMGARIFPGVTAPPVILFARTAPPSPAPLRVVTLDSDGREHHANTIAPQRLRHNPGSVIDLYTTDQTYRLLERIGQQCVPLERYITHLIAGIQTWKQPKGAVMAAAPLTPDYKPLLEGRDIGRYRLTFRQKYICYREDRLNVLQDEHIFLVPEKILIQRISSGGAHPLKATLDRDQFYCYNSINTLVCHGVDQRYILALLNSRLFNWLYSLRYSNRSTLTVNIANRNLRQLPIMPPPTSATGDTLYQQIIAEAERLLVLNQPGKISDNASERAALEESLDEYIYTLYGLTDAERRLVVGER